MIKVLYVIAGDFAFDEMLYVDQFIGQLDHRTVENRLLAPPLPSSQVTLKDRHTEVITAGPGYSYEEWQKLLVDYEPQIVILCDPAILLSEDAPNLSYMEPEWLQDIPCVVAVMDFRMNLLKTPDDQLALKHYVLNKITPPYALDYDFLIKICPPHNAIPTDNPKLFQWGTKNALAGLSLYTTREEVRIQLGCKPESRLITLVFPLENTIMAIDKGLFAHFGMVIESVIYYLNQLEDDCMLAVINMPPPFEDYDFDNVQIRFFPTLDMPLLDNLLKSSELLLTESLTYPGLSLSALRDTPAVTFGSSLSLEVTPEGPTYTHAFETLDPFFQMKLDALSQEDSELIFPYLSFPMTLSHHWPQTELYREQNLFYLADLFDATKTSKLIDELLNGGPYLEDFKQALQTFRQKKLDLTQDAETIIRTLVTAPPRSLGL